MSDWSRMDKVGSGHGTIDNLSDPLIEGSDDKVREADDFFTEISSDEEKSQVLKPAPDLSRSSSSSSLDDLEESIDNLPGEPDITEFELAKLDCIRVQHPTTGAPLDVPTRMLTGNLAALEKDDQASFLQMKITVGQDVAAKLLQGQNVQSTPDNISSLMWYLQVAAENKTGSAFSQGAISMDDPGGNIRQFLDSSSLAYQRKSTHVSGFQNLQDGFPRGINMFGLHEHHHDSLPYGKQTVLFQAMGTQTTKDVKGMPRNMLLLKMEEHGCFSSGQQKIGRGPTRLEIDSDKAAFWGHVKTTFGSVLRRATGNNTPEGSRKERMSSGLKKAYETLASWKGKDQLSRDVRTILSQDKPTSSAGGIRVMMANIAEAQEHLSKVGDAGGIEVLKQFVDTHFSDPKFDHYDVRIGEEVILTQNEI